MTADILSLDLTATTTAAAPAWAAGGVIIDTHAAPTIAAIAAQIAAGGAGQSLGLMLDVDAARHTLAAVLILQTPTRTAATRALIIVQQADTDTPGAVSLIIPARRCGRGAGWAHYASPTAALAQAQLWALRTTSPPPVRVHLLGTTPTPQSERQSVWNAYKRAASADAGAAGVIARLDGYASTTADPQAIATAQTVADIAATYRATTAADLAAATAALTAYQKGTTQP